MRSTRPKPPRGRPSLEPTGLDSRARIRMLLALAGAIRRREPEEDMARRKRIPYKPDAFQTQGRRIATFLLKRGTLLVAGLVLALVLFVVAAIVTDIHATAEENAWTALGRAGGDVAKLRAALAEYGSCEARPFALFAIGRAELERPREGGKPKPERDEERAARLSRADNALGELVDEYPDHFLHLYALCLRAQLIEERGNYRDAAAVFETALASASRGMAPKLEYDIGRNYYLAGMPKAARPHLEEAAGAGRTIYGEPAEWILNARYLLARIGPRERAISLEVPEKKADEPAEPKKAPEKAEGPAETGKPPAKPEGGDKVEPPKPAP